MNGIGSFFVGSETNIVERNVLWNTASSFICVLISMLLDVVVMRTLGTAAGDISFFAFSTFGQQIFIIAYLGVRPVQVADVGEQAAFDEHRMLRLLSCAAAVLSTPGYDFPFSVSGETWIVLFLTTGYEILGGFADCYDSELQRQERLYLVGESNAFRILGSVAVFLVLLSVTRSLVAAYLSALIEQTGIILLCYVAPFFRLSNVRAKRRRGHTRHLFAESRWLFLGAFLDLHVFTASKYTINRYLTAADNGCYTAVFILASVINLMANFVVCPVLTLFSEQRERGDKAAFQATAAKIGGLIFVLTLLDTGLAWLLGIPALSLLVGVEAGKAPRRLRMELLLVILGGGPYVLLNLLYYRLVILKRQRLIFLIYVSGTGLVWLSVEQGAQCPSMCGAALSYCGMMLLFTLSLVVPTAQTPRQDSKFRGEA